MTREQRLNLLRAAILVLIIGLSVALYLLRDQVQSLGQYGYPGIFVVSILTNATLIVPLPSIWLTAIMGTVFNPFWVAIAAGTGAAIGELSGYLAGFSGQIIIQDNPRYERLVHWMRTYGDWTILALAFIPNPAFDLAGITAGALKLPVHRFLIVCTIGKILKMMMFAYFGAGMTNLFGL